LNIQSERKATKLTTYALQMKRNKHSRYFQRKQEVARFLQRFPEVEGVVLSGGVALNVVANTHIAEVTGYPVYVPSSPSDCGLSIGMAWLATPPPFFYGYTVGSMSTTEGSAQHNPLQYLGAPLWDLHALPEAAEALNAVEASITSVASVLAAGGIVAIVRGRQEVGPRALGHRSLLSLPGASAQASMNRLKVREWWRPVAPVLAAEVAPRIFRRPFSSPYMSFAPLMRESDPLRSGKEPPGPQAHDLRFLQNLDEVWLPAVRHVDGSARAQTVTPAQDPWLHALLLETARQAGPDVPPVLCNTSFNTKGRPIINRLDEALFLLRTSPDLAAVVVNDKMFLSPQISKGKLDSSPVIDGTPISGMEPGKDAWARHATYLPWSERLAARETYADRVARAAEGQGNDVFDPSERESAPSWWLEKADPSFNEPQSFHT
jgi:predicted NodU family carbamoyl transferase